jgi:hypothetical protein
MIDSPGYGDNIDISTWRSELIQEIKRRNNRYESKINAV